MRPGPRWIPVGLALVLILAGAGVGIARLVGSGPGSGPGHPKASRPDAENGNQTGAAPATQATGKVPDPGGTLAGPGSLGPGAPTAAWVTRENALPGTRAWVLTKPALHHEIEGFANHVSIDVGGAVNLYVSTTAPTFTVTAFRMGYYGGAQGRLVWTSAPITGTAQPGFTITPGVNTVSDAWQLSATLQTDAAGWPPGDYLFLLSAASGYQSYIPLTIRDDASTAAYVINNDVTTWQAYNLYGGYDLYNGPTGYPSRSRIASFDRPYTLGTGSGDFLGNELHVVSLVESLGLDVTYITNVDLNERPELLAAPHRAFLSLGHDEYYSLAMRTGLVHALTRGVNLVFFGANAIYRHIRLQPSPLGPDRLEVDYKDPKEDPLGPSSPDVTPVAWRFPPNNLPESEIIGNFYQCNPVHADLVVADPGSWVFHGTGLAAGSRLTGLVGTEYDHYDPHVKGPGNVSILARSPLTCQGRADYADMTYYSAPSGAGVFATGTLNWVPMMEPSACSLPCPGPSVVRITENILTAFGAGPAGRAHPSVGNDAKVPIPGLTPAAPPPSPPPSPQAPTGTATATAH